MREYRFVSDENGVLCQVYRYVSTCLPDPIEDDDRTVNRTRIDVELFVG